MDRGDASCPLCGARMHPSEWLDSVSGFISTEPAVLAGLCPHCQGYIEIKPETGQLVLGYLSKDGKAFEAALTLPFDGLTVEVEDELVIVKSAEKAWSFTESED